MIFYAKYAPLHLSKPVGLFYQDEDEDSESDHEDEDEEDIGLDAQDNNQN